MNAFLPKEYQLALPFTVSGLAWRSSASSDTGEEILVFAEPGVHRLCGFGDGDMKQAATFERLHVGGHTLPNWKGVRDAASDGSGDILFATPGSVWRLDASNSVHRVAGAGQQAPQAGNGGEQGQQDGPGGTAVFRRLTHLTHGSGDVLYVLDDGHLRVVQRASAYALDSLALSVVTPVLDDQGSFRGLACDSGAGALYLATQSAVYKVPEPLPDSGRPELVLLAGKSSAGVVAPNVDIQFGYINSLAVADDGRLFICSDHPEYGYMGYMGYVIHQIWPSSPVRALDDIYEANNFGNRNIKLLPHGGIATFGDTFIGVFACDAKPSRAPGTYVPRTLNHAALVASDLSAFRANPSLPPDVSILAGGRAFPAHRLVLAARCEYFARLFAGGFADSGHNEVPLPDSDPDAFELLLSYMYGGELRPTPALLRPLAELADRLLLAEASAHLQRQVVAVAGPGSVVDDMLWAEARGLKEALAGLKEYYVRFGSQLAEEAPESVERLMRSCPKLHLELHAAMVQRARRR